MTALLILVGALSAAPTAGVQRHLSAAGSLYESLEYERALQQLQTAHKLSQGATDDVAITLLEGVVLADMGRTEEARAAFRSALLLEPGAQLPVKTSPKIRKQFDAVKASVAKQFADAPKREAPPPQRAELDPR